MYSLALAGCGPVGLHGGGGSGTPEPVVSVLAGPPEISGANGIRFDADGKLYIGSVGDGKIYRIDPDTGTTLSVLGAESGIQSPDDLTIAEDGTLYSVNILQGTVVAVKDGQSHVVADLGLGVDGIALSPNHTLIIGKDFFGDGLYEVDPSGATAPRTINAEPGWVNAMAFGADGTLYVPVWQKGYVGRVDLSTGDITQFSKPFAITAGSVRFDTRGNLFAVDGGTGDLNRIDLATGNLTRVLRYGMPLDNLAFDAKNRLFISSYADGSVNEVLAGGFLRTVKAPGLLAPLALAATSDLLESVYVADTYGVHEFDGVHATHRGGFGSALGLTGPRLKPIALRVAGTSLLALGQDALETWDRATGNVKSSVAISGGEDVVAFAGAALVSLPAQGSVVTVANGSTATFATGLGDPAGLAASASDVFVTIYSAGEVRQIAALGKPLDTPRVIASGLAAPEGVALLPNGALAVVETGTGSVVRIDLTSGAKSVIAENVSPAAAPGTDATLGWLNAVAVGASQHLYVLSPAEHTVRKVRF